VTGQKLFNFWSITYPWFRESAKIVQTGAKCTVEAKGRTKNLIFGLVANKRKFSKLSSAEDFGQVDVLRFIVFYQVSLGYNAPEVFPL
jgi:hypothetical protein